MRCYRELNPRNTNHLIFLGKNAKNQVFSRIGGELVILPVFLRVTQCNKNNS